MKKLKELFRVFFPYYLRPPRLNAPDKHEQFLIDELRKDFKNLENHQKDENTESGSNWQKNINRLSELVLKDDPRAFLSWDVIRETMYVSDKPSCIIPEFKSLKKQKDFSQRWLKAIRESGFGSNLRYHHLKKSSGNAVHLAYHLLMFENTTNKKITDHDLILEFGGGYGRMAKLIVDLGYQKQYIIFDLAHFSALQKYYLKSEGVKVINMTEFLAGEKGVLCISSIEDLKTVLKKNSADFISKLFIGTWSLSETPVSVRDSITPLISDFSSFLIIYQHRFYEVDNVLFFKKFSEQLDSIKWTTWEIPHYSGNNYLIGYK